jgi:type I restriction-modification system DNA methylase subunit
MPNPDLERLRGIRTFPSLVKYLRDDLDWPIESEDFDDLTFDFEPEELGIDPKTSAKIESIKQLRPLSSNQPWGIFFVKFEPKKLPVVALRRVLGQLVIKKRASANRADQQTWRLSDLLFLSNYGENEQRQITFAHFSGNGGSKNLPTLKVLGWDDLDTALHMDYVHSTFREKLCWPDDEENLDVWRRNWSSAFTLRHREVIETSKELAVKLAGLAQQIRKRANSILSIETEDGPLQKLMAGFKEALIHDLTEDSFSDMYAQTIAYGLLTARITNPKGDNPDELSNQMPITNPFLKELMESFLSVGGRKGKSGGGVGIDFDELGINEVVALLDDSDMEAVVRDFGDKNPLEDPVMHFYEHFLQEYDTKARMQRGVFYTPRPVVSFIVRSVDEKLRTEFGLEDGLADTTTWGEMTERNDKLEIPEGVTPNDPFVKILDPAVGTGTFLAEVIDLIHITMIERWKGEGQSEKKIMQLWNDYVTEYLLPRLYGYELLMAPYAIAHMKIGLKLHETGYGFSSDGRTQIYLTNALEPGQEFSDRFAFAIPALAHEARNVNEVKLNKHFTVVVGNPPYANFGQLNRNPTILELLADYKKGLIEKKINLDDDYIKFIRFAQYHIDKNKKGIVACITNNSFLDGITHRRMRECLLEVFDKIYMCDLHGNSKRQEKALDGGKDENVFDIQQGVCIFVMVKNTLPTKKGKVIFGEEHGLRVKKYESLKNLEINEMCCSELKVPSPNYFFIPRVSSSHSDYKNWMCIKDIFPLYTSGIQTKRDKLTIQFSREQIEEVKADFISKDTGELKEKYGLPKDGRDWKLQLAKDDVVTNNPTAIEIYYRTFDIRYTLYSGKTKGFLAYPRKLLKSMLESNLAFVFKRQAKRDLSGYTYFLVVDKLISEGLFSIDPRGREFLAPLYSKDQDMFHSINLSQEFITSLEAILKRKYDSENASKGNFTEVDIFDYVYGVVSLPRYRLENFEVLCADFPRIPLPKNNAKFESILQIGRQIRNIHLFNDPKILNYKTTFPLQGSNIVERIKFLDNRVYVNQEQFFERINKEVWSATIGGYQPCQKWLKDRKGKRLSSNEIEHFHKILAMLKLHTKFMGKYKCEQYI